MPGPTAYRPPLYPVFLGVVYRLAPIKDQQTWARVVQAGVGTATVWLLGVMTLQLFRRRRLAHLAMGIAALWPPMWLLEPAFLSEVLVVPLILGAVVAALKWRQGGLWRWIIAAGVLAGLATLTRANAAALLLPLGLAAWPSASARRRLGRRAFLAPLTLVLLCLLTVAPWTARNAVRFHRLVPVTTEDGYTLAGTYNEVARSSKAFPAAWVNWYQIPRNLSAIASVPNTEEDWNGALRRSALSFAGSHPAYVLKVGWWNLRRVFDAAGLDWMRFEYRGYGLPEAWASLELASFLALLPLILLGASVRAVRLLPRWILLVGVVMLLPVFMTGYLRFRAPIDPFLVMLAAAGGLDAVRRLSAWRPRRTAGVA
ncbi:MAG: glycosyltransferase family 39 protein [Solirubrobacteraceae bacterium]